MIGVIVKNPMTLTIDDLTSVAIKMLIASFSFFNRQQNFCSARSSHFSVHDRAEGVNYVTGIRRCASAGPMNKQVMIQLSVVQKSASPFNSAFICFSSNDVEKRRLAQNIEIV